MKTAIFVVLAITAVTAEELLCQPGSFFNVDCNSCSCAQDGRSFACTDMICPPKTSDLDRAEPRQVCKPRSTFKDYCNTCFCSEDGTSSACTMMECDKDVWNKDGTKKVPVVAPKQICVPKSTFKDYCNTCLCSEDGLSYGCTFMYCDKEIWNKDGTRKNSEQKQVCQPRSQFKDYCNTCFCAEDGLSYACTRMYCDKDIWNKDGTSKLVVRNIEAPKKVCQPRAQFKDYCNTCTCDEDGLSYACTRMFCDKNIWNKDGSRKLVKKNLPNEVLPPKQVCKPLSTFKSYCNTCFCSADGTTFGCTRMYCDKNIWNKDGTSKLEMKTLEAAKQVCEPLTTFKDQCNTCTCSADGTKAFCTRMLCDEEDWSEDDTSKLVMAAPKQVCTPLTKFKDYCNTCFCSADGTSALCTRMFCDKDIWNKDGTSKLVVRNIEAPKKVCQPRAQFMDYCNTCTCDEDGLSYACTRMFCDKNIWKKNGTKKLEISDLKSEAAPKQVCTPHTNFKLYCNTCFCSADGLTFGCTRMYCDKEIWNKDGTMKKNDKQMCEPGRAFKVDKCNTCVCNEDGTDAACTMKLCTEPISRAFKLEDVMNWGPLYKQGDACTPGQLFYSECNRCVCGKSGNSAMCTFMKCH